jgi:single-strand DNA-binding protein
MSHGLNRVMLLGNLGADPELRRTQAGQAVLNLRLATTESYLDKDKVWQDRTEWHNVVVWGERGEALARILTKGSAVLVEGALRTSSYEDRERVKRYKTEVIARDVLLTGARPHREQERVDAGAEAGARGGTHGEGASDGGPAPTDRARAGEHRPRGASATSRRGGAWGQPGRRGGAAAGSSSGGRRSEALSGDYDGGARSMDDDIPF